MAYWWVSQNQTYRFEREGGYLWAPRENSDGKSFFHWDNMKDVQPGDTIFSYFGQKIVAVSIAVSSAYQADRPSVPGTAFEAWELDGWKIDANYEELSEPVELKEFASSLQPFLPSKYSPLTKDGTGNQGYLFALPSAAGKAILDAIGHGSSQEAEDRIADAIRTSSTIPATTRVALTQSRIGQGQFRDDVLHYWQGRCAATGVETKALLRASHIKPWCDSNNEERLDKFNGLCLSPNYDAAFDRGLISFEDNGAIKISTQFHPDEAARLGIDQQTKLSNLDDRHGSYLEFHRQNIFDA